MQHGCAVNGVGVVADALGAKTSCFMHGGSSKTHVIGKPFAADVRTALTACVWDQNARLN